MKIKRRISKKDIHSILDAIDFISANTDCVTDEKQSIYYNNLLNRLNKIYKLLKNKNQKNESI